MNETAQKAEPFGNVAAVVENFFPRGSAVNRQEFPHVRWLREEIGCVAEPWDFHDYRCLTIENILGQK